MTGIRKIIQQLSDKGDEIYAKVAKVTGVDKAKRTCDVEPVDGSAAIFDVRLQATPSLTEGLVIFPEVGSYVVVVFLNHDAGVATLFSEVESIYLRGHELGGMVKIEQLVQKLNALEKAFNSHLTKFNLHTHSAVQTGGGTSGGPVTADTQQVTETKKSDLENDKVKHG